ncbi:MAG: carbamoyltransferase HypF [Planctomycetaceae bacterium]
MRIARRIILEGRVQGFGVRPSIARLAERLGIAGRVRNRLSGVEIEVHGERDDVEAFEAQLASVLPEQAIVQRRTSEIIPSTESLDDRFQIETTSEVGAVRAQVPADVVMCAECLDDVRDPSSRRFEYPLTTCAVCGPRFSVITSMPFERDATTLRSFATCRACADEYANSKDRRCHAQTIACPNCGPRVWCVDRQGHCLASQREAIDVVVKALQAGQIVALRGIGGYQLLCDAMSSDAVRRLRSRKQRPSKPLAVLVESLEVAQQFADISAVEAEALTSRANPIVLLRRRTGTPASLRSETGKSARPTENLAAEIHPGLRDVGLLLPSSPLHWLIVHQCGRPLVATSGNLEGEPLVVEVAEAESRLASIADLWLHHDRPIANAVDDSVVRVIAGRAVTLRMARGFAPLALPEWPWKRNGRRSVLATGGHLKNAVALDNGEQAVLGPHLGDLDREQTRLRFVQQVEQLRELFGAKPELVVHDLHPGYFTTEWAKSFCSRTRESSVRSLTTSATVVGLRTLAVQHHHAHVLAVSWEQGWLDREVLGLAWDGTGFGSDGSLWGGETLRCRGGQFERVGSCRPFRLPGGEAAIREPWRVAAVLLREAVGETNAREFVSRHLSASEYERFFAIAALENFSPRCTSIGRLFDAVAAIVLGISRSEFEGQPAMLLESLCERRPSTIDFVDTDVDGHLDWRPLVRRVWQDLMSDVPPSQIAELFHHSLARFAVATARRHPALPIVLSGGVFQNRVLVESLIEQLGPDADRIGLPGMIPPNDGGLAAGQLAVALMAELPNSALKSSVVNDARHLSPLPRIGGEG